MANVLNRTTKEYRQSVNTPEFDIADWIYNPDMTAVSGYPNIYWIITNDIISLMEKSARDVVDAQIAADAVESEKTSQKNSYSDNDIFRAQIKYVVDEVNALRANAGLTPARTYAQARTYMFDAINNEEV